MCISLFRILLTVCILSMGMYNAICAAIYSDFPAIDTFIQKLSECHDAAGVNIITTYAAGCDKLVPFHPLFLDDAIHPLGNHHAHDCKDDKCGGDCQFRQ